jgi:beta-lactamase superfamily II metal-dependent hydrolase
VAGAQAGRVDGADAATAARAAAIDGEQSMKPARVTLRALWCDQGMAHLLTLYDAVEATAPTSVVLIDFGAETMFKSRVLKTNLAAPAVTTVVEMLLLQQQAGLTPKLDYVLISHQDTDHWSLLNYLMDAVDELAVPMKVGQIIYAGADWGKGASDTVKRLRAYGAGGDAPVMALKSNVSDYRDANGTPGSLLAIGDLVLRILIANAPISSKSPALRKNGTSAIVVIDYHSERMILPGDSTWETLWYANKLLNAWTTSPVQPVKIVSVPHHGALDTITRKNLGKDSNLDELRAFTDLLKPEAVIASAGYENSFKHPYLIVLKVLGKYAEPSQANRGLGEHKVVVYRLDGADWQLYESITKNIYTTVIGLTSPVPVADYLFTRSDFGFFTDAFGFYGPSKAVVSVPTTSVQVLNVDMEDANKTSAEAEQETRQPQAPLARPRLQAILAPPPAPPVAARRVAPVVMSAAP